MEQSYEHMNNCSYVHIITYYFFVKSKFTNFTLIDIYIRK